MREGNDPVLIGAVGGSGTRVLARILRHAGIFMGRSLNPHEDSQPFVEFYETWIPLYLRRGRELSGIERRAMEEDFERTLKSHLRGRQSPSTPWGVKNPRSLLMLPWWHERFPNLRFIHVLRNGMDMACSQKLRELRLYRYLALSDAERASPKPVQAAYYWAKVNAAAMDYARQHLRDRYLLVRFEDLCLDPGGVVERIFEFLGVQDTTAVALATKEVKRPDTIGRWRSYPPPVVLEVMKVSREALQQSGYWRPELWKLLTEACRAPRVGRWLFKHMRMRWLNAW